MIASRENVAETVYAEKSEYLVGQGIEQNILPCNNIGNWTIVGVFSGMKLSGHTDTLTEASFLIDKFYKIGEIENKQQHRNVLDKFHTV